MDAANIALALEVMIRLAMQTQGLARLIQTARIENRDITNEELTTLAGDDDLARIAFDAAIARARSEGR